MYTHPAHHLANRLANELLTGSQLRSAVTSRLYNFIKHDFIKERSSAVKSSIKPIDERAPKLRSFEGSKFTDMF